MSSAFYNSDPIPSGRGWLVYPVRRLIRRLQRPYYLKLQSVIDAITAQLNQVDRELDQTRQELNQTRQELDQTRQELNQTRQELQYQRQESGHKVRALACDHTAVVRRLAAIEDQVITGLVHAEDSPLVPRLLAGSGCRSPE